VSEISPLDLTFRKYDGEKFPHYFEYNQIDKELVEFYQEDAGNLQTEKLTYLINVYLDEKLVAYFAYTASEMRRGEILKEDKLAPFPHPCLKLGRLLVCRTMRGKGVGTAILQEFATRALKIGELVSIRFLTVDSKPGSLDFYKSFGFVDPGIKRGHNHFLYIDLNKIPE
jgi:GNAT superfamily N-acetyltransferase